MDPNLRRQTLADTLRRSLALEQALRFAHGERLGPFARDRNGYPSAVGSRVQHARHYRERVEGELPVGAVRAIFADRARHLGKPETAIVGVRQVSTKASWPQRTARHASKSCAIRRCLPRSRRGLRTSSGLADAKTRSRHGVRSAANCASTHPSSQEKSPARPRRIPEAPGRTSASPRESSAPRSFEPGVETTRSANPIFATACTDETTPSRLTSADT